MVYFQAVKKPKACGFPLNGMDESSNGLFNVEKYQQIEMSSANKDFFNEIERQFLLEEFVDQRKILFFL